VKAIDVAADGSLWAALVDGKELGESRPVPSVPSTSGVGPVGEVTVSESFSLAGPPAPSASPSPRPIEPLRTGGNKGAVVRVSPTGEVDPVWTSNDEMPHALVATDGAVLAGTGNKGKLSRLRADRTWTMISSFPGEQVTSLVRVKSGEVFLATSNPGKVHALEPSPGSKGTLTTKARDTDTV